jgi:hypothetical protein
MEIVNGKVVQTTEIDLSEYINDKKSELELLDVNIKSLTDRQASIIAELESLVE